MISPRNARAVQMLKYNLPTYIIRDRHSGQTSVTQSLESVMPYMVDNATEPKRTRYAISRFPAGNHLSLLRRESQTSHNLARSGIEANRHEYSGTDTHAIIT